MSERELAKAIKECPNCNWKSNHWCGFHSPEIRKLLFPEPFAREKAIIKGLLEPERPGFSELSAWLTTAPKTWLPALLIRVVAACEHQKVFKDGGLMNVVKKAQEDANNPTSILRK